MHSGDFTSRLMAAQDTIVAQATPPGPGGIAVVRISGPDAWHVGRTIFRPKGGAAPWKQIRRLIYGHAINPGSGEIVDEVLCAFFKGPNSYSAEDAVELQCHGGPAVVSRIIQLALAQGCRTAGPGEFTLRGMIGGRIDLSRAEAVASLVAARSDSEARTALAILEGGLAGPLHGIRQTLVDVAASIEAAIDFPEDVSELAGAEQAHILCDNTINPLDELITNSLARSAYREGASVVICGRPNVGKSSLFNALLGRKRTIVSDTPGTTRDRVDEVVILGGIACRLSDTAGLGNIRDDLDGMGQDAARDVLQQADLALVILDGSTDLLEEDLQILAETQGMNRIVVINKNDLARAWPAQDLGQDLAFLEISAKFSQGMDQLSASAGRAITHGASEPGPNDIVVNARQREALSRCLEFCRIAADALHTPEPQVELISLDLHSALAALGEVDGQGAPDEIIDAVFNKFCVGK